MVEDTVAKLMADFFKTLSHPVRVNVLRLLKDGERCVCEMIDELDIKQSNLSQHLRVMKKQGLIDVKKDGQRVMYHVEYPSVFEVISAVEQTLNEQISRHTKFAGRIILKCCHKKPDTS